MAAGQGVTRRTVLFQGHVQGVGFRYTTVSIARGFPVTGYVRNLPDGRVELVAEGADDEVQRFVQAVESQMAGYVQDRRITAAPATGEFRDFSVRR